MRNHHSIALVIPGHPFPSMKMLLGRILIVFGLAVISGNSWADSRDIPDFPIPLKWGMTKNEIMKVISENNLHIAVSSGKHLGRSSFGFSEYYEWAAIKEETLKYRGYRRFIILRLDGSDRLVAISMKLKGGNEQALISEFIGLHKELGKCMRNVEKKSAFYEISSCVWLINKSMWLEYQAEKRIKTSKLSSYIILHWKKP